MHLIYLIIILLSIPFFSFSNFESKSLDFSLKWQSLHSIKHHCGIDPSWPNQVRLVPKTALKLASLI